MAGGVKDPPLLALRCDKNRFHLYDLDSIVDFVITKDVDQIADKVFHNLNREIVHLTALQALL